ncbi:MAG: HAD-IIB family hydrolase, partial [Acidobacteriota bacterium]
MNSPEQEKEAGSLYIAMISLHGLVTGTEIELGRDADTGGQTKYVVDLAKSLSKIPEVGRVDLFTRQIFDRRVDPRYTEPLEQLGERSFLVRIPCGPRRYLRKEKLWPYIELFTDNMLSYFNHSGRVPDVIHGHYADAGLIASRLAAILGIPMIFTGHSLGRSKKEHLLEQGYTSEQLERKYQIGKRIEAEEVALDSAQLVITSTKQEHHEQYAVYANYKKSLTKVIPPGVLLSDFSPPKRMGPRPPVYREIARFLEKPEKPMILALSRPDERKNVGTLVEAYGESQELQDLANLVLILGNRDRILNMDKGAGNVLGRLLFAVDDYNLYGKIAYPKTHSPDDVPDIYRLAARSRGVFVNPALTEPFGLTILEAAACGLPMVATRDGGPSEILEKCKNGLLVDPLNKKEITSSLIEVLTDKKRWTKWSKNGVRLSAKQYTWEGHSRKYVNSIKSVMNNWEKKTADKMIRSKLPTIKKLLLTDLDGTLFGNQESLRELMSVLKEREGSIGFGIATGRTLASATQVLREWNVLIPNIMVTCVGSEIYYGLPPVQDHEYSRHINYRWAPDRIRKILGERKGFELQPENTQRPHKISYFLDPATGITRQDIVNRLRRNKLAVQVIYSHDQFLDILPLRASKGHAIRYLAMKWKLPMENILVAGDSGNDEEMLRVSTLGVAVGNRSHELEVLKDLPNVYFAKEFYAGGIIEG